MYENLNTNGLYRFCITIVNMAYINFLWILFVITGFGVFGLFPSTVAIFSTVRQFIKGNNDFPIFQSYWQTYKTHFLKSNLIGFCYIFAGIVIYFDVMYFSSPTSILSLILLYFFRIVAVIYLIFGLFLFPVYVHYYQEKWWRYFKSTAAFMMMSPLTVIAGVAGIFAVISIFRILPGLIPVFMCSSIAYFLMLISFSGFDKIEQRLESQYQ